MIKSNASLLAVLLLLSSCCTAPVVAKRKLQMREGPCERTIEERGLTDPSISAGDLVEGAREYDAAVGKRRFGGNVLGYVTPWNRGGYEAAVRFRGKLTHVSPVWYQLKTDDNKELALTGGHEFNATWMEEIRAPLTKAERGGGGGGGSGGGAEGELGEGVPCGEGGAEGQTCSAGAAAQAPTPLIVPRVIVELGGNELGLLLARPGPAIDRLVTEVTKRGYDGLVLEAWQQWASMGAFDNNDFKAAAVGFTRQLGASLRDAGKALLLAMPPAVPAGPGRPHSDVDTLWGLGDVVDGYSVMTYDYLATLPGHNGPLPWQQKNLEALLEGKEKGGGGRAGGGRVPGKVLMGVNFYGYEFTKPESAPEAARWSTEPVLANRFLNVLSRIQPKIKWDDEAAESFIKFKDAGYKRQIYFPTPASLAKRVRLARDWGAGLSIWELGQGMDAFFDLL